MQMGNRYYSDYERKKASEAGKFSGKAAEDGSETASQFYRSEPSSATRMTKQTGKPRSGLGSRSSSPEKGRSELGSAVPG